MTLSFVNSDLSFVIFGYHNLYVNLETIAKEYRNYANPFQYPISRSERRNTRPEPAKVRAAVWRDM